VEKIAPLDGAPSYSFKPEERGELPVSEDNLQAIQEGMHGVIHSSQPQGTAYFVLANLPVDASGKTGTAQTATEPHAWFAGYTDAGLAEKSDIAVAIILENAGEGSVMAAPIFRRIIHLYFSDNQDPGVVLPWESSYYQVATPEPEPTGTPPAEGGLQ
jgi:penicillin-binding protein 2